MSDELEQEDAGSRKLQFTKQEWENEEPPQETDVGAEGPKLFSFGYNRPNMAEIEGGFGLAAGGSQVSSPQGSRGSQTNVQLVNNARTKLQQNIFTDAVRELYHNRNTWRVLKTVLAALVILRILHGCNVLEGSMLEPLIPFKNIDLSKLRELFRGYL